MNLIKKIFNKKNKYFNRKKIITMMKKILTASWNLINDNILYYEKERRKVKITLK